MSTAQTALNPIDVKGNRFITACFDALPAHIAIVDANANILLVNRAWEKFARDNGATTTTTFMPGGNYFRVCERASGGCGRDADRVSNGLHQVLSGAISDFSYLYACHSPTQMRWFTVSIRRFQFEQQPHAIISHANTTSDYLDKKNLELLAFATKNAKNAVIICDSNKRIEWINKAFTDMTGFGFEAVMGKEITSVISDSDSLANVFKAMQSANCQPTTVNSSCTAQRKDGREFTAAFTLHAIRDDTQEIANYMIIANDISELVRYQQGRGK